MNRTVVSSKYATIPNDKLQATKLSKPRAEKTKTKKENEGWGTQNPTAWIEVKLYALVF